MNSSTIADVRDYARVRETFERVRPDVVFHMAAQSHVLRSYEEPVETYSTNVLGTVHVLEAARQEGVEQFVAVGIGQPCTPARGEHPAAHPEEDRQYDQLADQHDPGDQRGELVLGGVEVVRQRRDLDVLLLGLLRSMPRQKRVRASSFLADLQGS